LSDVKKNARLLENKHNIGLENKTLCFPLAAKVYFILAAYHAKLYYSKSFQHFY